ncbi:glutamate racemase [Hahella sp. CCB-MM4]|nr:glutamate racemase [Hahella sp. CCB-MM4]
MSYGNSPALILDSGSGGLTVWGEIVRHLPQLNTFYLADFAAYPYGLKSEQELTDRVILLLQTLVPVIRPGLLVVACNTASTIVLDTIRQQFPFPVVGVVPAVKTAASLSRNRRIGVLATPGTVQRQYLEDLIHQHASDCQVTRVGSNALVGWAEDVSCGQLPDLELLQREIVPVLEAECDQVVLGCTHFPLLKPFLLQISPHIGWVDSGQAIARRVADLLTMAGASTLPGESSVRHVAVSSGTKVNPEWENGVARLGFHQVMSLSI